VCVWCSVVCGVLCVCVCVVYVWCAVCVCMCVCVCGVCVLCVRGVLCGVRVWCAVCVVCAKGRGGRTILFTDAVNC